MGFTLVHGEDGSVRVEFDDQSFTDVMRRYVDSLQDENDQLRELVRDLWAFECGPNSGANSAAEWAEIADALHDRMRELGVSDHGGRP